MVPICYNLRVYRLTTLSIRISLDRLLAGRVELDQHLALGVFDGHPGIMNGFPQLAILDNYSKLDGY